MVFQEAGGDGFASSLLGSGGSGLLSDGVGEEKGLLRDEADGGTEVGEGIVADGARSSRSSSPSSAAKRLPAPR